jgi:tRNA A-37 threonylcarbamoyl transferase component Bud32
MIEPKDHVSAAVAAPCATTTTTTRGGRHVVLKRLDDDCLLDGQLHPSIKLRLERVRELPVRCVANFLGVERDPSTGVAQMVWEFVPGTPLAEVKSADWLKLCREVVLAVQSLHAAGIVHGAIHGGNVILDDRGEVRLTHVSPLLYSDADHDAADVVAMLDAIVNEHAPGTPLAAMLAEASTQPQTTLSELYAQLAEVNVEPPVEEIPQRERNPRARYLLAAALVALIGIAMSLAIYWRLTADESQPYAPPVARNAEP